MYLLVYFIIYQLLDLFSNILLDINFFFLVNDLRQTLPSLLTEKTAEELENLPPYVEKCIMVYIPDIQHCLAITEWNGPPPDDEMIPGLEFKFSCNNIRYYKSKGARGRINFS